MGRWDARSGGHRLVLRHALMRALGSPALDGVPSLPIKREVIFSSLPHARVLTLSLEQGAGAGCQLESPKARRRPMVCARLADMKKRYRCIDMWTMLPPTGILGEVHGGIRFGAPQDR